MSQAIDRSSPMVLWNRAKEFFDAASLVHSENNRLLGPIYFLACQSIELSLKAYLRGCGATIDYLKRDIGHDLTKALCVALVNDLDKVVPVSREDQKVLNAMNQYYASKDLQYPKAGFKTYPLPKAILKMARRLVTGTEEFCFSSRTRHTRQKMCL